ncbi:hypothetical protein QR680_001906 [Steinernema hermaphroditum]|uniref:ZP domain-containing protein n=1 Tax=Steinernema hermaphroditum TaxID=289476 RepID=A0AA39LH54_9BILA|nr:hypothetical protein QR680_001906 [Steinernema hermaphroditum]
MKSLVPLIALAVFVWAEELPIYAEEHKIESCDYEVIAEGLYRTLVTKHPSLCKLHVQASEGSSVVVTVKSKGQSCSSDPSKIFVVEDGKNSQLECDGNEERLTSASSTIGIVYSPRKAHLISFKFVKRLPCNTSIGFNTVDQSFLLENKRGENCLVLVPGRTKVVLERLHLVEDDCRSHIQMRTGPHISELKFSSRLFCAEDNNLRNAKTVITCNKGVILFKSESIIPESVMFHIEIVEDDTALAIAHYKCFE